MPKNKVSATYTIEETHSQFLKDVTSRFEIADESKALRILIEYAIQDADVESIFAPENTRCHDPENCPHYHANTGRKREVSST
jgi:hypothetical protein